MTTIYSLQKKLLGRALAAEHIAIDALLGELRDAVDAGDWRIVDAQWSGLEARLDAHLHFEEKIVLPRFAAVGAQEKKETDALLTEHAQIREQLEQLGLQIELQHASALWLVGEFIQHLRDHARREDNLLYPWLDAITEDARVETNP
jgi:hypothetical protein